MNIKMKIPFFGIDRMYANHSDQILSRLHYVYSHGRVLQGPEVSEFEDRIAKFRIKREEQIQGQIYDISYYIYFIKDVNGLWKIESF